MQNDKNKGIEIAIKFFFSNSKSDLNGPMYKRQGDCCIYPTISLKTMEGSSPVIPDRWWPDNVFISPYKPVLWGCAKPNTISNMVSELVEFKGHLPIHAPGPKSADLRGWIGKNSCPTSDW